jgi:hypothetical protein
LLGGPFVALILLGPALVAVGLVVILVEVSRRIVPTGEPGGRSGGRFGRFLKVLGGALMLGSVGLLVLGATTGSEIVGFYSTISLFLLALPGLGLFLVGSFLRTSAHSE